MAGKQTSKSSKTADSPKRSHVVPFSAADRTLSIPELLSTVFSLAEAPELATSARVCKKWSGLALDELWRDLESVLPLLDLLVDLELVRTASLDPEGNEVILSAIAEADWPRFHSYAKRVQIFRFYNNETDSPVWDCPLVGAICLTHPYGPSLLPRLRRLEWCTNWSALLLIPFLSEDLVHLDLQLEGFINDARVKEIIGALRHRKLKLKTFRLDSGSSDAATQTALALWLEKMETLETLELAPYYLSARILTAIRTLPRLQILKTPDNVWGVRYRDTGSPWALPGGSFPSLVKLTLPATPTAAKHLLFNSRTDFTGLTALKLLSEKDITANQILAFTQQLVDHCPMINTIELELFLIPEYRSQGTSVLPIKILESLYPCKHLNTLRICHPLPLKLNSTDVENMARAWPHIKHLYLCPAPDFLFSVSEQMGTGLSILPAFALHLPKLQTLGLYFNGRDKITFDGHLHPRCQFTQLQNLIVGLSPIPTTRPHYVGFYLASLCSRPADIEYGRTAWHGETAPTDHTERLGAWRDVEESMAFAMRVKLAGQD